MNYVLIKNLKTYPQDGKHQECIIAGLPFDISKGRDSYTYLNKKGKETWYGGPSKTSDKWICHLTEQANNSLFEIFEIEQSKDLDKLVNYCIDLYIKSLSMEIQKVNKIKADRSKILK